MLVNLIKYRNTVIETSMEIKLYWQYNKKLCLLVYKRIHKDITKSLKENRYALVRFSCRRDY